MVPLEQPSAGTPLCDGATGFTCPRCGGGIWEQPGEQLAFRCRLGHGFSAGEMLVQHANVRENRLWSAYRGLEEHVALRRRLAGRARDHGHSLAAQKLELEARQTEERATVLLKLLDEPARLASLSA